MTARCMRSNTAIAESLMNVNHEPDELITFLFIYRHRYDDGHFTSSKEPRMVRTHNLGFARIGAQRELKFALESFWQGQSSRDQLKNVGAELRRRHWDQQAMLDVVPVGDF